MKNSAQAFVNLFLKRMESILYNIELWMTDPSINEFFIKLNRFLNGIIPCLA
jgi:hypothetical protein